MHPSYSPALRLKAGEQAGLRDLAPDVADRILPRIIVPPRGERDNIFQLQLLKADGVPNIADPLAASWLGRDVLVEATHLIPDLDRNTIGLWLPKMFERARRAGVFAIPLVTMADLTVNSRVAYKDACAAGSTRLGIVVPSGELVGRDALQALLEQLDAIGMSPADCAIIADFADSEFTHPEIVAPIIGYAVEILQELGQWGQIIFQGTNYPDKNPAEPAGACTIPRNEWLAWRQAVRFDPTTAEHMLFGDFAADCATMAFGESGGRAIRHYRYTTPDAWIIQRGAATGSDASAMQEVCRRIVADSTFAGRSFSSADEYIFLTSTGEAGPGNSTIWRAVNTTHHITRVVSDIGRVRGFAPRRRAFQDLREQLSLFRVA